MRPPPNHAIELARKLGRLEEKASRAVQERDAAREELDAYLAPEEEPIQEDLATTKEEPSSRKKKPKRTMNEEVLALFEDDPTKTWSVKGLAAALKQEPSLIGTALKRLLENKDPSPIVRPKRGVYRLAPR